MEDGRAMLLAGLRRVHAFTATSRDIPMQWEEFRRMGPPPGRQGTASYGVICGANMEERSMEYMCAVEVDSLQDVPPEYGRMRITRQRYAVFTHEGGVSKLGDTWGSIWNDWLPRSGYQSAHRPDFERYDERFDPETGSGTVEIWVAVQSA
ncbi:putative transcriptional regulator YdeE [Longimicrobium terrae]|uniref:Putative transcriptional regulator YdeE n=2 Tax=Longimicrobium terrae TaxID=1639882 RepID=A0A841GNK8_9BACT|nr:GyrI-like domain-containing protein [Longimicrobium terrae]MBB6068902.1 putative transcriptional regulator YdeE [Longimicrobium terrae]